MKSSPGIILMGADVHLIPERNLPGSVGQLLHCGKRLAREDFTVFGSNRE
ncbi:MAG: hypothetical protein ACE5JI_08820 [Acidobacteriota bacterium]